MANTIGWGKGTQNNTNGWGKYQNTIDAGSVYADSYAGETVLIGTSAAFSYSASSFHQGEADPTPTITGTTGGTFSATPSGLSINTSTGTIDLDNSTIQSYTITYTVSGVSANQTLAVTASPFIANNFSIDFNGIDNYILANNTGQSLGITEAISFSAWVKLPLNYNGGPNPRIASFIAENWFFGFKGGGTRGLYVSVVNTDGTLVGPIHDGTTINDNNWHHVAATYDGTTNTDGLKAYVDGVHVNSATATSTGVKVFTNNGTVIGAWRASNPLYKLQGNLDEVAVWNTALSSDAVQEIYNATYNNTGKVLDLNTDSGNYTSSANLQYWNRLGD